jgi:hypothetical protein
MSDFKCVACRIRTRHTGDTPRSVGDPCPHCGSPLELVGGLAEVVGYRPVSTADRLVESYAPVADLTARRNAIHAQQRRDATDAARWVDDGGAAVVAVSLPTADRRLALDAGAPGENGTR